jgi:hypothetical protein
VLLNLPQVVDIVPDTADRLRNVAKRRLSVRRPRLPRPAVVPVMPVAVMRVAVDVAVPALRQDESALRRRCSRCWCRSSRSCPRPMPAASGAELAECAHLVHHIQRGDFVGLRERRVVEHRIHQILDGAATAHYRLADVYEFGCVGAEDVYPQ